MRADFHADYGPPPTHPPEIRTSGVVVATVPGRIMANHNL